MVKKRRTVEDELSKNLWTPSVFGNRFARSRVWDLSTSTCEFGDCELEVGRVARCCAIVAEIALAIAISGHFAQLYDCAFAIEFARKQRAKFRLSRDQVGKYLAQLESILEDSSLREYWKSKRKFKVFEANVVPLVDELRRYPKVVQTKFREMTRAEALETGRGNISITKTKRSPNSLFIHATSEVSEADLISLGRFSGINELEFWFEDVSDSTKCETRFQIAMENWLSSLSVLRIMKSHSIDVPVSPIRELSFGLVPLFERANLSDFSADEIFVGNAVALSMLNPKLEFLTLLVYDLDTVFFERIREVCPKLDTFFIESGNYDPDFLSRLEENLLSLQKDRLDTLTIHWHNEPLCERFGRKLSPLTLPMLEGPQRKFAFFPFELEIDIEDGVEIAKLELSDIVTPKWCNHEEMDEYLLNGYGVAGLLKTIIHDEKLSEQVVVIEAEAGGVSVTVNGKKVAKRLGKLASEALKSDKRLRRLIERTRELGFEN